MAAATTVSLSLPFDLQKPYRPLPLAPPFSFPKHYPLSPHKSHPHNSKLSLSSSSSSSSSTSPSTTTSSYSFIEDQFNPGRFLTNEELQKLKTLESFAYYQQLKSGSLLVRVMRPDEMDMTVSLLAESFSESMLLPSGYEAVLRFLVKQYLMERKKALPHAATLIGFFRERGNEEGKGGGEVLAGTVEVTFDKNGANASSPSPAPPKDLPYVCNMTVKMPLRRRGIGWHLLKASEELIAQMSFAEEVYLHCRMIDTAPFNMYTKAGYNVVRTDSILILLTLQRRKHLMCKKLPVFNNPPELELPIPEDELTSPANV